MVQTAPPFQTKEEYAYQVLRQAILQCELAPDEKLIIDRLSVEMGLSQIPIRAAIQRLTNAKGEPTFTETARILALMQRPDESPRNFTKTTLSTSSSKIS